MKSYGPSDPVPSDAKWLPEEYCDEVVPPPLDHPTDWIVGAEGDLWRLLNSYGDKDGEDAGSIIRMKPGDTVKFCWFATVAETCVTVNADRTWSTDVDVSAATNFIIDGDSDTLAPSVQDLVEGDGWRDPLEPGRHSIEAYIWSDPIPFVFVVKDGKPSFERAGDAS